MNIRMTLSVSSRNIPAIVKTIIAVNTILLAGTYIFNTIQSHLPFGLFVVAREMDLASENNFAAWYSSMLLLMSAFLSLFSFLIDEQHSTQGRKRMWNAGWLFLAGAFALLSFDELGSIHEHIGNFTAFAKTGSLVSDTKDSGWTLFYVVVGVVGLFMLLFSVIKLKKVKWALPLLVAGILLYLSNPIQENFEIEALRAHAGNETWQRPVFFLLLEEGSEVFGSLCILLSVILYVKDYLYVRTIGKTALMRLVVFFLLLVAITFILIGLLFGDVRGDVQNGVPKNWITAASLFSVSGYCVYIYNTQRIKSYLLFAIFCLCLSIYFGDNRLAWYFNADYTPGRLILKSFLSIFALLSYLYLLRNFNGGVTRLLFGITLLLIVAGIFIKRKYSAELVFAGISCFSVLLIASRSQSTFFNKIAKTA